MNKTEIEKQIATIHNEVKRLNAIIETQVNALTEKEENLDTRCPYPHRGRISVLLQPARRVAEGPAHVHPHHVQGRICQTLCNASIGCRCSLCESLLCHRQTTYGHRHHRPALLWQ